MTELILLPYLKRQLLSDRENSTFTQVPFGLVGVNSSNGLRKEGEEDRVKFRHATFKMPNSNLDSNAMPVSGLRTT